MSSNYNYRVSWIKRWMPLSTLSVSNKINLLFSSCIPSTLCSLIMPKYLITTILESVKHLLLSVVPNWHNRITYQLEYKIRYCQIILKNFSFIKDQIRNPILMINYVSVEPTIRRCYLIKRCGFEIKLCFSWPIY